MHSHQYWISALILGSLLFMNTWDFPAGLGLFVLVFVLKVFKQTKWSWSAFVDIVWKVILLVIGCVLLYLPFFLGFASQAGGIFPSLLYSTRGAQFGVMFFPFLALLLIYLMWVNRRKTAPDGKIARYVFVFLLLLILFLLLFPFSRQIAVGFWNGMQNMFGGFEAKLAQAVQDAQSFAAIYHTEDIPSLIRQTIQRRLQDPTTVILLLGFIFLVVRYLFRKKRAEDSTDTGDTRTDAPILEYVNFLILLGAGLCLLPEFIFLGDVFQTRMNTIFKFYFQTWILWSIAGSFVLVVLWDASKRWKGILFKVCMILVLHQ
mgnify:CR=1 FL=1